MQMRFATLAEAEAYAKEKANTNIETQVVEECEQCDAEAAAESNTITLLPRGCETQEGTIRVNKALEAFDASHVVVANAATAFLREHGKTIRALLRRDGDEAEAAESFKELEEAVASRGEAQDEFLRAVAGQPSRRALKFSCVGLRAVV